MQPTEWRRFRKKISSNLRYNKEERRLDRGKARAVTAVHSSSKAIKTRDEHGAVFVELALVALVLITIIGGIISIGNLQKEQKVLEGAAHFAANHVKYFTGTRSENNDVELETKAIPYYRLREGVLGARNAILNSGLNPDDYQYECFPHVNSPTIVVRVKSKSDRKNRNLFKNFFSDQCVEAKVTTNGPRLLVDEGNILGWKMDGENGVAKAKYRSQFAWLGGCDKEEA